MESTSHIAVIDNYDSFTFNLVHLLEQLDVAISVHRNDDFDWDLLDKATHLLLGPGPGLPSEAGELMGIIESYKDSKSILGVCLGMQALLEASGVDMVNMPQVEHGMKDQIKVVKRGGLFAGLETPLQVGRYHSWAFSKDSELGGYEATAVSDDGYIMAVQHASQPLFGVQFHPESVMTLNGLQMVRNWLKSTA